MLDVLIKGALVVDGTGSEGRRSDVGIRGDRIVVDPTEEAAEVIDADGLVLAPGFVDIHTHYDSQLFWDPSANPSPLHGVTSIIAGNCGFTVAPSSGPDDAAYLKRLLGRVEGIPLAALDTVAFDWTSFGDYLTRLGGRFAVNAGFLVGHSALRRYVMGAAAVSDAATPAQIAEMVALLHESIEAGGLGFSSSTVLQHFDGDGAPVPSRAAGRDELLALASAVKEHPGTAMAMAVAGGMAGFSDDEITLMGDISLASGRPVNWTSLRASVSNVEFYQRQLECSDAAARRGGCVRAIMQPQDLSIRINFISGFMLDSLPGWRGLLFDLSPEERLAALADPEVRRQLVELAGNEKPGSIMWQVAQWDRTNVGETYAPLNAGLEGRTVGSIAAERGGTPFDVLCDIVIADELRTGLDPAVASSTAEDFVLRAELWQDDRTIVGGSDAGAHLDAQCGAIWSTWVLGEAVREQGLLTLEAAVRQLSDVPARLFGLRDRGRIADGWFADLVLFDPQRVAPRPIRAAHDLPGGAFRYNAEADGVERVWVNGTEVVQNGKATDALPGGVLRPGADTETVSVPGTL